MMGTLIHIGHTKCDMMSLRWTAWNYLLQLITSGIPFTFSGHLAPMQVDRWLALQQCQLLISPFGTGEVGINWAEAGEECASKGVGPGGDFHRQILPPHLASTAWHKVKWLAVSWTSPETAATNSNLDGILFLLYISTFFLLYYFL